MEPNLISKLYDCKKTIHNPIRISSVFLQILVQQNRSRTLNIIKFLKENEETWRKWLEPEVGEKIIAAVKGGKISLVNQKCIPAGGSGGAGSPNC